MFATIGSIQLGIIKKDLTIYILYLINTFVLPETRNSTLRGFTDF